MTLTGIIFKIFFNAFYWTLTFPSIDWLRLKFSFMITGANRLAGVDISTIMCMTFTRVTVTLSKLNGGDNSYLHDANMSCLHHSVFDKVTQGTRVNVIHNLVEISTPASRFALVSNTKSFRKCSK